MDEILKRLPGWFFGAGFFLAVVVVGYQVLWRGESLNCGSDWLPASCETPSSGNGIPSGAVVAFDGECPSLGWRPFTEANGRFLVGAGEPTDPKHGTWQQQLPSGNLSQPRDLTTYVLGRSGGEETHLLSEAEMPSHSHRGKNGSAVNSTGGNNLHPWGSSIVKPQVTVAVEHTGGGEAHNNIPPYYPLNFCRRE